MLNAPTPPRTAIPATPAATAQSGHDAVSCSLGARFDCPFSIGMSRPICQGENLCWKTSHLRPDAPGLPLHPPDLAENVRRERDHVRCHRQKGSRLPRKLPHFPQGSAALFRKRIELFANVRCVSRNVPRLFPDVPGISSDLRGVSRDVARPAPGVRRAGMNPAMHPPIHIPRQAALRKQAPAAPYWT